MPESSLALAPMSPAGDDAAPRPEVGQTWYRFEPQLFASALNEYDEPAGQARMELREMTFEVVRVTPKGVWLEQVWRHHAPLGPQTWLRGQQQHFVRLHSRKKFAHASREDALQALIARKTAQERILGEQLFRVRQARSLARYALASSQRQAPQEALA